ncbi:hypothetical protein [Microbacterium jejuense]|uniref:hypothetical protein n=1 Tax=Microbacterium jejuense TaxID=1263637 RepID=UPI0031E7AD7E
MAFLRNVNQGQRGHPSTAMILDAFAVAGCDGAVTFQSNGTVVFSAAEPDAVVADAAAMLDSLGYPRAGFAMAASEIANLGRTYATAQAASRMELTLHGADVIDLDDDAVVRAATHRRCRVIASGAGWVVSLNERERESNGTPVVEQVTGGPATSRSIGTVLRLLDRHGLW